MFVFKLVHVHYILTKKKFVGVLLMKANHAVRCNSDQLFSFTEKCGEKKSQTKYPAELVPSHRVSNNSSSHASERIIAAECLCLINCGYVLSTFVSGSFVCALACMNQCVASRACVRAWPHVHI